MSSAVDANLAERWTVVRTINCGVEFGTIKYKREFIFSGTMPIARDFFSLGSLSMQIQYKLNSEQDLYGGIFRFLSCMSAADFKHHTIINLQIISSKT
jgi:hypothetical protein